MKTFNYKKTFSILFLFFILAFLSGDFCLAQGRGLEISYPNLGIPGIETPTSIRAPLPEYIKYIFSFTIIIAGLIAFGVLIYGGVRYLTSAGNPGAIADAKDRIFSGLLGIIILLASYFILATINPQLVIVNPVLDIRNEGIWLEDGTNSYFSGLSIADLRTLDFTPTSYAIVDPNDILDVYIYPEINYEGEKTLIDGSGELPAFALSIELKWKPYGVYLCKDSCETAQECVAYDSSSASLPELVDNNINCIYAKQSGDTQYRIVLHNDQDYKDKCWYFETNAEGNALDLSGNPPSYKISASSVHIFRQSTETPGKGVSLFSSKDYNLDCGAGCFKNCSPSCGDDCTPKSGWLCTIDWKAGECWNYTDTALPSLKKTGNSILIEPERRYMAILFEKEDYGGKCEVFTSSDPFLEDNYIRQCAAAGCTWLGPIPVFNVQWRGCFTSVIVKPIK